MNKKVDERLFQEIVSGTLTTVPDKVPLDDAKSYDPPESRKRKASLPDYDIFLEKQFTSKQRGFIYVSEEVKNKLIRIAFTLTDNNISLTNYVENILRHHLQQYKDEINKRYEDVKQKENLL